MKTKKQLLRELKKAEAKICEMQIAEDSFEDAKDHFRSKIKDLETREEAARTAARKARQVAEDALQAEADASARAAQLMHINDVLCAELQDCDRCIDTVRMALEQKSARAELLNRITGPLV